MKLRRCATPLRYLRLLTLIHVRSAGRKQAPSTPPLQCPPLFEGDYWLVEYLRLFSSYTSKHPISTGIVGGTGSGGHLRWCKEVVRGLIAKSIAAAFR